MPRQDPDQAVFSNAEDSDLVILFVRPVRPKQAPREGRKLPQKPDNKKKESMRKTVDTNESHKEPGNDEDEALNNGAKQDVLGASGRKEPPASDKGIPQTHSKKRKLADGPWLWRVGQEKGDDYSKEEADAQTDSGALHQACHISVRYDAGRNRRQAEQKEDKRYAMFQLSKQDGSETQAWCGEEEIRQLFGRLELVRTKMDKLLGQFKRLDSMWTAVMTHIKAIDVPAEQGEEGSGPGPQPESIGDVARGMGAPLEDAFDSWIIHDYELKTFLDRVKKAICNRAFESRIEVPQEMRRFVADIPRTWDTLQVLERLGGTLVSSLRSLETYNLGEEQKGRNDRVLGETKFALKQLKLVLDDLA
ncbi:hypothetical protein PG994_005486 [Apiospora phragmitis]|uniref:Uncharacterized protein n=1 Tax=Apiospora phragmitis TaxID=2905665 RepID=A0ABR1VF56_9PEZI